MKLFKYFNLALAFFLELSVLAALIYWGFVTGSNLFLRILLGIGTPVIAIIIWGRYGAPKSANQLKGVWYWLLRIVFDAVGVVALFLAGQPVLGAIFAVVALINCVLGYVWKQYPLA
ncbi:YrdB family protein [Tengunoibacter tsumagoiensis]|uniref:DUF2568 domain-containing protein n=1 Tax=Tengunoibacter tsumagoiensis TaxID=2014871 RepID=A0A402A8C6_9CHLR|nr:YrdB family protein [Tengunoibacter tsumagoiensis]GCE15256.1 hypothetical protein KTT_51150 [Tengunoibacter tsumagoiensis]